jgi:FAD-dependent oxidoreductase domain-containing protein 1
VGFLDLLFRSLGAKSKLMTPKMLKEQFPWLNTDGIAIGCYGKIKYFD